MIPYSYMTEHEAGRIAYLHHHQTGVGIALATGVFDLIHRGHVELLERASTYGPLFVGINTDEAVRELKGDSRPINKLEDRAYVLSALRCVKIVFPIDSTTVTEAIMLIQPSHWVKGGGYTMKTLNKDEVAAAKAVGAEIILVPMVKDYSTTKILEKKA